MTTEKKLRTENVNRLLISHEEKMRIYALMGSKALVGSVTGYMSGRFARMVTDWAVFYAGMGVLLVGGLHYLQWITINWKKVDEDVFKIATEARNTAEKAGLTARIK